MTGNKVHTHYDNLKIARDAPLEVIRAAYLALSQMYHPDHNPGNPDAARIMSIINASYVVLSDPEKRHEYDLRLVRQEFSSTPAGVETTQPNQHPPQPGFAQRSKGNRSAPVKSFLQILLSYWYLFLIAWIVIYLFYPGK